MDINSLLSPQDSPAMETPPPLPPHSQSPSKRAIRQMPSRTPSGLSQQITSSPQYFHHDATPAPTSHAQAAYHHHLSPALQSPALQSPGITGYTNGRGVHSATNTPPFDRPPLAASHEARMTPPHPLHRQASTPGMDALADLASMQHVQQAVRQQSVGQRPSISLQNIPRSISGSSEMTMAEPSPRPPRIFNTKALDAANIEALNQLEKALAENPFDYYSHVSFISILHQGLQNCLYPSDGSPRDGYTYELLPYLREAYEAMDGKYTLGERLWEYRITDEQSLARNVEERMLVLELCQKATREEPYSAKLWVMYGEYIGYLIDCVWNPNAPDKWSEEDKMLGKELFTTELLMDTWHQGAEFVKYDVADSSLVWDRYLQLLQDDLERHYTPDKARRVSAVFNDRLSQPHSTWDNTFSKFSTFNSRYNQNNYEAIMEHAVSQNTHIKKTYALREEFEFNLLKAVQAGDQDAEYYALTRYLKWEKKTIGVSSFHLVNALYERATVRFPVDPSLWEDHVEFLIWQNNRSVSLLDVLERATRHCPWSGSLWSHRILTLESEEKPHHEIENVKHSATKTGMLEHTDLEELMKVQIAWCGYLRRKIDDPTSTEDDADIAEIGIRSALELAHETGTRKYGKDWKGDPKYRLERIHIKFCTQRGHLEEARHILDSLVKNHQDSYDFWYRYYIWEMVVWANHAVRDKNNAGQKLPPPSKATAALERGMQRLVTLDSPEPLVEMYVNHCEQHESVLKVRSAIIERRKSERTISIRRAKEAAQQQQSTAAVDGSGKRKWEDAADVESTVAKKSRQAIVDDSPAVVPSVEAPARPVSEAPSTNSTTQKRDREHSSIIVKKLPSDTTQTQVRKFFSDCGTVKDVIIKLEQGSVTATVEFEAPEEAEYALSKEAKGYEGHDISISRSVSTTLYVTNYPAHADDAYLRNLFSPYGQILQIRFPSLKFDAHRRFCYVQFSNADEAIAATKIDGRDVEGLKILAKISDPNAKKKREGATEEGREVYVRHLSFTAKKDEIEELFSKYGKITKLNLPTNPSGRYKGNNKGFCFIAYDTKENAEAAVAAMHGQEWQNYKLHVEIAKSKNEAKPKVRSELLNDAATSEVREPTPGQAENITSGVVAAPQSERTIAILDVPDTVSDARIKALVEPYGYKKITLMPQHSGAIIEFLEVSSVGKASLSLEGYEIAPGRKIRVGTVAELKKTKGEYKPSNNFIQPNRVNRPVARGAALLRGRGKAGLGRATVRATTNATDGEKKEAKSNEDFRTMLLGKKKDGKIQDTEMKDGDAA